MRKTAFALIAVTALGACTKDGQSEHEKAIGILLWTGAAIAAGGALGPF